MKQTNICILLDSDRFYYPYIGGIEKHCYELSIKLVSNGINIVLISRKNDDLEKASENNRLLKNENFHIERTPPVGVFKGKGWKAFFPMVVYVMRIMILLFKYNKEYDVIMVSGFKILSLPAMIVAKIMNKKCVLKIESPNELTTDVSEKSLDMMSMPGSSLAIKIMNKIRSMVLRNIDNVVAISKEIEDLLMKRGVEKHNICVIPSGINVDTFQPVQIERKNSLRSCLLLPEEKVIFAYIGRLTYNKGVMLLVHAWKKIKEKRDDIHLLLVGPGKGSHRNCEEELRSYLDEHNLKDSVTITGEVEDITKYLQASDIFVFPSEYEGFSVSLLEALACSLPVIATRVGSAPEIIVNAKNGILITPGSQTELEGALCWFLGHKETWDIIGNNARQTVVEQFSMDVVTQKYISLFENLLERTA